MVCSVVHEARAPRLAVQDLVFPVETISPPYSQIVPLHARFGKRLSSLPLTLVKALDLREDHFHHHVGSRINEDLRVAFMADLEENPPEMFMEAKAFPKVSGLNTSDSFPARDAFLAQGYRVVENDDAFLVYLRNDLGRP